LPDRPFPPQDRTLTTPGPQGSSPSTADFAGAFPPGTVFAERYRIVSPIGRGGMGLVYRAEDLRLGQTVALKFLPQEMAGDPARLSLLHAEVRNARLIAHPNVCRVYDISEHGGRTFLSMEYVDGEDLASLLKRIGRLPTQKAVEISHELCAGLAAAHDKGVIHRDLKPANIMIDGRGQAQIMDFGLAVSRAEGDRQTGLVGTLSYMAPEQWAGSGSSVKSDIYALGLVLYELFTGHRPFEAGTPAEFRRKQTAESPVPPSTYAPHIDPAVENVILRCLAKNPDSRPASAVEIAAALPGGNPLQAAIAAGLTPSPEMVAAAGAEGSLKPAAALGLLGVFAVVLVIAVSLAPRSLLLGLPGFKKNPWVLAERSRELTGKLGLPQAPRDSSYWYEADEGLINWLAGKGSAGLPQQTILRLNERTVRFRYRQSPQLLMPDGNQGFIKENNPPLNVPGMVNIDLDTEGRLLRLVFLPWPASERAESSAAVDWGAVFSAAGLDIRAFRPEPPKGIPAVSFDRRESWTGTLAGETAIPVRVEGASFAGIPVFFEVRGPWDHEAPVLNFGSRLTRVILPAVWFPAMLFVLFIGVYFARRNIRMRRGDLRGALWISTLVFVALASGAILFAHHAYASFGDFMWWIRGGLAFFLFDAVYAWVCYMAIEPYMRRLWPEQAITWNRFLSGRFRDPLVGRDILTGAIAGTGAAAAMFVLKATPGWLFLPGSWSAQVELLALSGTFRQWGMIFYLIGVTAITGVGLIVAVTVPYLLFRSRKLAVAVCFVTGAVTLCLGAPASPVNQVLFACVGSLILTLCLFRFGVFSAAAAFFVLNLLTRLPLRFEPQSWAGRAAIMTIIIAIAVTVYGFAISLGGRPLFGQIFREE
jgi:Protein kinase domain